MRKLRSLLKSAPNERTKTPTGMPVALAVALVIFTTAFASACPDAGSYDSTAQQAIVTALTGTANSCVNNNSGVYPKDACNVFVGAGLQAAYSVDDFFVRATSHYYSSYEILKQLPMMPAWQILGTADDENVLLAAQQNANAGLAVVAVAPGHVALIIPGDMISSGKWGTCVPNSASESTDPKGPHYIGKGLSFAWGKDDRKNIQIWARNRVNTPAPSPSP